MVMPALIFVLFSTNASAQKNVDTQHLLRTHYYLKLKIDENYQLRQEIEEGVYWLPCLQYQFLFRTFAERKPERGRNVGIRFTYFLQSLPHDAEITSFINQLDLRPQLEVAYKLEIGYSPDPKLTLKAFE